MTSDALRHTNVRGAGYTNISKPLWVELTLHLNGQQNTNIKCKNVTENKDARNFISRPENGFKMKVTEDKEQVC